MRFLDMNHPYITSAKITGWVGSKNDILVGWVRKIPKM
jgi:hypothetical protein